jgi:hypothetical protein
MQQQSSSSTAHYELFVVEHQLHVEPSQRQRRFDLECRSSGFL